METNFTPANQAEIKKCAEDFFYFCETYVQIIHPKHGLIPFKLFDFQKRYVKCLQENRFVAAIKFRQGGFTTVTLVWLLWRFLFKIDESLMYLVKTDKEAVYANGIVRQIISELPDFLKPNFDKCNDHQLLSRDTNNKWYFYNPEPCRGRQITYLFIDESAFIAKMDQHWQAIWPTISTGGHCITVSTPNEVGNWFHNIVVDAKEKKNAFTLFEADYWEHPEYGGNVQWCEMTRAILGERGFRQEILKEFLEPSDEPPHRWIEEKAHNEALQEAFNQIEELKNKLEVQAKTSNDEADKIIMEAKILLNAEQPKTEQVADKPQHNKTIKDGDGWWMIGVDTNLTEPQLLHECRKRAFEKGFKNPHPSIIDSKEPIRLCEGFGEEQKVNQSAQVHFDVERPRDFRGYYYSDVVEEIAEEHIAINEDYGLSELIEKKKQRLRDLEDRVNAEVYGNDMLVLAGVISEEEKEDLDLSEMPSASTGNCSATILAKIKEFGDFPSELQISFSNKKFCVGDVPTNINEFDLCCLYNGLAAFTSDEKAADKVAKLVCKRMTPLFGLRKEK